MYQNLKPNIVDSLGIVSGGHMFHDNTIFMDADTALTRYMQANQGGNCPDIKFDLSVINSIFRGSGMQVSALQCLACIKT